MKKCFIKQLFLFLFIFFNLILPSLSSDVFEEKVPMNSVYNYLLGYEDQFPTFQPVRPTAQTIEVQGGVLQVTGLKITIPSEAVSLPTAFSIKPAPPHIEYPKDSEPLIPLFEIEPHHTRFANSVTLSFDVTSASHPVSLFIRKETPESHLLDKWLLVPPIAHDQATVTFEVKSFSHVFVGTTPYTLELNPGNPQKLTAINRKYDLLKPGLSYRAVCEDRGCLSHIQNPRGMIISRGFGSFTPSDDLSNDDIKCIECQQSINDPENIKDVIFFRSQGTLTYTEKKRGAKKQQDNFNTDDKVILYSQNKQQIDEYRTFDIEAKELLINLQKQEAVITYDSHGNPIGNVFDLGADKAFKDIKLLIGKFYGEEGFTEEAFKLNPGKSLDEKGFKWLCTENEDEFLRLLPDYHIAWIIPGEVIKNLDFPDQVISFYKKGGGLMLWEDNDTIPDTHTTATVKRLFNITLAGNDPGDKIMKSAVNTLNALSFDRNHPIATGLDTIYEGCTICFPDKVLSPVKVFATSSARKPNIMYVEKEAASPNTGAIIIDCGYTKLFPDLWDKTAGTQRYVKNAVCWLAGATTGDT